MAGLKTQKTDASVEAFLGTVEDPKRLADARSLVALMREITGEEPHMWGEGIIGFGSRTYHYESGRSLDWFPLGFSPRKAALALYIMKGYDDMQDDLAQLGRYSLGKSCLYLKRLSDVDWDVLRRMLQKGWSPG